MTTTTKEALEPCHICGGVNGGHVYEMHREGFVAPAAAPSVAPADDSAWKVAVEIANDRLGPRSDAPQFWDKYASYVKGVVERHFAAAPSVAPEVDEGEKDKAREDRFRKLIETIFRNPGWSNDDLIKAVREHDVAARKEERESVLEQIRGQLVHGNPATILADIAALVTASSHQHASRCEHGVTWSMECLSCGHSDYVAASPAALRDEAEVCVDYERDPVTGEVFTVNKPYTPPSTLAKAAAEEIFTLVRGFNELDDLADMQAGNRKHVEMEIAAIIERCLSGGGESVKPD